MHNVHLNLGNKFSINLYIFYKVPPEMLLLNKFKFFLSCFMHYSTTVLFGGDPYNINYENFPSPRKPYNFDFYGNFLLN